MGRQLGRFLKTMGAASGVAPTPAILLAMVASMEGPPSSGGLTWEVLIRWGDSASSGGYGGLGWGKVRTRKGLFIGGK
jgi:hypothetical protein